MPCATSAAGPSRPSQAIAISQSAALVCPGDNGSGPSWALREPEIDEVAAGDDLLSRLVYQHHLALLAAFPVVFDPVGGDRHGAHGRSLWPIPQNGSGR